VTKVMTEQSVMLHAQCIPDGDRDDLYVMQLSKNLIAKDAEIVRLKKEVMHRNTQMEEYKAALDGRSRDVEELAQAESWVRKPFTNNQVEPKWG